MKICLGCNGLVEPNKYVPNKVYCSESCRENSHNGRLREKTIQRRKAQPLRICDECKQSYKQRKLFDHQRFCSSKCTRIFHARGWLIKTRPGYSPFIPEEKICLECHDFFVTKGKTHFYCSLTCRNAKYNTDEYKKAHPIKPQPPKSKIERTCPQCLNIFLGRSGGLRRYCSEFCRSKFSRLKLYVPPEPRPIPPNLSGEEWKNVVGWEGYYEVSNLGRVRQSRSYSFQGGKAYPGRLCCFARKRKGGKLIDYVRVNFRKKGFSKKPMNYSVHRLVAMAFIPNPDNLPQVNHINFKKDDNRIENLEWCTGGDNTMHYRVNNPAIRVPVVRSIREIQTASA